MGIDVKIRSLDLEGPCYWTNNDYRTTGQIKECQSGDVWDYSGRTGVKTDEVCPQCKGTGTVPTDLGWQVLEFVKRHEGWER